MGNSDSHASFIEVVEQLLSEDVPAEKSEVWSQLFAVGMSVEEIFEIVSPDHVRLLRKQRPKNLETLLRKIVQTLSGVAVDAERRPSTLTSAGVVAATNAVRLLTRVAPFLLEEPDDQGMCDMLFRSSFPGEEGGEAGLADQILECIMRFLFLPNFAITVRSVAASIPVAASVEDLPGCQLNPACLWRGGICGSDADSEAAVPTQKQIHARSELLRCLLVCLSGPLFQTSEEYQERPSRWLTRFVGGTFGHSGDLFCSLMSLVFSYDPVGWGVPYAGYFGAGTEEELVDIALQVLCVLMDFDPAAGGEAPASDEKKGDPGSIVEARPRNVFRLMLQGITEDGDIDLIYGGLVRLLSTMHQASTTYLPNSLKSVGFYQEALVLLWHLITSNQHFVQRLVNVLDSNQVVTPVLYLLHQAQDAAHLVGLLHTASFVLLVLSSERSFAVRLNEAYNGKAPLDVPKFRGNHADLLLLALHKVISDSLLRPQNDALLEMLLTVLCNVSPYVKALCGESCLKLLALINRCSRPSFLFRSAYTHHGLIFLLEMLNNIIQYQFEGNAMLMYSILRQKEMFQNLSHLELSQKSLKTASASGNGATNGEEVSTCTCEVFEGEVSEEGAPEVCQKCGLGRPPASPEEATAEDEEAAWTPTEEWLQAWKKKMPLQPILCLINHLGPQVENMCSALEVTSQEEVLAYLQRTTMVGILPVPHPIVIRTYQSSSYTAMWFTSYLWGVIFTRSRWESQGLPLYDWKSIRLVVINN